MKNESDLWKLSYDAVWKNLGQYTFCLLVTTVHWFQCGMMEACTLL